jgi:hypothetical protein
MSDSFPVGSSVRVARPDACRTVPVGTVGTVVGSKPYDPILGREGKVITPACVLVWTLFGPPTTWAGWRGRGEIADVRGMFDRELEAAP